MSCQLVRHREELIAQSEVDCQIRQNPKIILSIQTQRVVVIGAVAYRSRRQHRILRCQPEQKIVDVCKGHRPDRVVVVQHVLPEMVDESSQLQRVATSCIKEISAPSENRLGEILWSSVGYHALNAANVDGADFFSLNEGVLRADQARGRRILWVSSAQ